MVKTASSLLEDATFCPRDAWSKQDGRSTLKRLGTDGIAPHPFFFFPLPPFVWDSKTKMKRGWGYCVSTERRGRLGGTFVQGIHSTSSSINPLLCLFSSRAPSCHRRSLRRQTPEERRAVAIGRTPTRSPPSRGNFH